MTLQDEIERGACAQYREFLVHTPASQLMGDAVLLYGKEDIEERNATYEVQLYMPGWVAIGDDSGGAALLMRLDGSACVYRCDHGGLGSIDPEPVARSFSDWMLRECPLDDDDTCDG